MHSSIQNAAYISMTESTQKFHIMHHEEVMISVPILTYDYDYQTTHTGIRL